MYRSAVSQFPRHLRTGPFRSSERTISRFSSASATWRIIRWPPTLATIRMSSTLPDADIAGTKRRGAESSRRKEKRHRFMRSWDDTDQAPPTVHAGSYANADYCKRFGGTDDPCSPTETGESTGDDDQRRKRKVALLIAYLGTNYGGFQMTVEHPTIQATLERALHQCGLIATSNFGIPSKYSWSTSGRTDKGVHAAAQVCSCKLLLPLPSEDGGDLSILERVRMQLNDALPSDITVLDIVQTTRNFCAKTQRDRVRYQYLLPSYCLQDDWRRRLDKTIDRTITDRSPANPLTDDEAKLLHGQVKDVRVDDAALKRLTEAMSKYQGTNSFHNFTKGVQPAEGRASRYIVDITVQTPITVEGVEWIPISIIGQSFLLHQIRKMMSMAIDVARGATDITTLDRALSKQHIVRLHIAPAQGLFLEMSYYRGYNRRKTTNPNLQDIEWDKASLPAHGRWKNFKDDRIVRQIVKQEQREGNFIKYMYLQEYMFDYRRYYNSDAVPADENGKTSGDAAAFEGVDT